MISILLLDVIRIALLRAACSFDQAGGLARLGVDNRRDVESQGYRIAVPDPAILR